MGAEKIRRFTRLPQFRIALNSRCERACFYCRPSGETIDARANAELSPDVVVTVAAMLRSYGVTSVKLTGGDPALYGPLEEVVHRLKTEVRFEDIAVISRHPAIGDRAAALARVGATQFNLSIDTLRPGLHKEICGIDDLPMLLCALEKCVRTNVPCKVNTVAMRGINDGELIDIARYCESVGVRELKFLDVISDLTSDQEGFSRRLRIARSASLEDIYCDLNAVSDYFAGRAVRVGYRSQGGLGHPMLELLLESGLIILVKNSRAGAWYSTICHSCKHYPCHDALMALRLTPDARFQLCLLRDGAEFAVQENRASANLETHLEEMLEIYDAARFYPGWSDARTAENVVSRS